MESVARASPAAVQVFVRVRPPNEKEIEHGYRKCVEVDASGKKSIQLETKPFPKQFAFDSVVDEEQTQGAVFEDIGKPLSAKLLQGYNCALIAYGQTGAGKTFTMQGPSDIGLISAEGMTKDSSRGLIPRCLEQIFHEVEELKLSPEIKSIKLKCSYVQIYNEQIQDLLSQDPNGSCGNALNIREDPEQGTFVEGVEKLDVSSAYETYEAFCRGSKNRVVGMTAMNTESSRSHSVFILTCNVKKSDEHTIQTTAASLFLTDLAGSERQKATQTDGIRLKEATNINKSLSALGNVIKALTTHTSHIPYRDSKLTFLLKNALGGNSFCSLVACISPALKNLEETMSTLQFAQRAKLVRNCAEINVQSSVIDPAALQAENMRLREELATLQAINLTPGECCDSGTERALQVEKRISEMISESKKFSLANEKSLADVKEKSEKLQDLYNRMEKTCQNQKYLLRLKEEKLKSMEAAKDPNCQQEFEKPSSSSCSKDEEIQTLKNLISCPPEVVQLSMELDNVKNDLLKWKNNSIEALLDQTKRDMEKANEQRNSLLDDYNEAVLQKSRLVDQLKETNARLDALGQVKSEIARNLSGCQEELSVSQEQLVKTRSQMEHLQEEIQAVTREKESLEKQNREHSELNSDMMTELDISQSEKFAIQAENVMLGHQITTLEEEKKSAMKEIDSVCEQLQSLEKELTNSIELERKYRNQIDEMSTYVKEQEQKMDRLSNKFEMACEDLAQERGLSLERKRKLDQLETDNYALQATIDDLHDLQRKKQRLMENQSMNLEYLSQLVSIANNSLCQAQKDLSTTTKEVSDLKADKVILETQMSEVQASCNEMGKEKAALSNNLNIVRDEMELLKEKLKEANLERSSLQGENVILKNRITTIQEQIKEREVKQHSLEQICAKLEEGLKSSQENLADLNERIANKDIVLAKKQEQLEFLLKEEQQGAIIMNEQALNTRRNCFQIASLNQGNEKLCMEKAEFQERINSLEREALDQTQEIEQLEEKAEALAQEQATLHEQLRAKDIELSQYSHESAYLSQEVQNKDKCIHNLEASQLDVQGVELELKYQLEQAKDVITQKGYEEIKIKQEAEEAKAQCAILGRQENNLQKELDGLRIRYNDVEARLHANELENSYKDYTRIDDDILIRQNETAINKLRKEIDEGNVRNAALDAKLKHSLYQAEKRQMQVEEVQASYHGVCRDLKCALAAAQDADVKSRNERLILTDELSAVLNDRNKVTKELDDVQASLKEKEGVIENYQKLEIEIQAKNKDIEELNIQIEQGKHALEQFRSLEEQMEKNKEIHKVEKQDLRDQIKLSEGELESSREQIANLRNNYQLQQQEYQRVMGLLDQSREDILQLEKCLSEEKFLNIESANKKDNEHKSLLNQAEAKNSVLEEKIRAMEKDQEEQMEKWASIQEAAENKCQYLKNELAEAIQERDSYDQQLRVEKQENDKLNGLLAAKEPTIDQLQKEQKPGALPVSLNKAEKELSQSLMESETIVISSDSENENDNVSNVKQQVSGRNDSKSKRKPLQDVRVSKVQQSENTLKRSLRPRKGSQVCNNFEKDIENTYSGKRSQRVTRSSVKL